MRNSSAYRRWLAGVAAGALLCAGLGVASHAAAGDFGRVAGTVSDSEGNPLMGATVLLMGPQLGAAETIGSMIERVTTDAQGRFSIEHLAPGWYSLRIVSATRVPAMRDRVRVAAGETTKQKFVLGDFFSPFRLQKTSPDFSSWGDDWKWILRTSDVTRPVLRFQRARQASKAQSRNPLPDERVIGVVPGTHDSLSEDPGTTSVMAYLRPLGRDSDVLVAGSLSAVSVEGSSFVASFRRGLNTDAPQELSLSVHRLSFAQGGTLQAAGQPAASDVRGAAISYMSTRRLSKSVTVTAGVEADYLDGFSTAETLRPRMTVEYQAAPATQVAFVFGAPNSANDRTVLGRVQSLDSFPRVTLQGSHLRIENVQHMELAVRHRINSSSRLELAAYSDSVHNAAVWGVGGAASWAGIDGALLSNGVGGGVAVGAGNYSSKGFRAEYERRLGDYVEVVVAYANGSALAPARHGATAPSLAPGSGRNQIADYLRPQHTDMISARLSARVPSCQTQIVTSYAWMPSGRVTVVDPYDLASMDMGPFLGIEIRQPLPTVAFLPAHFEALAEFRNLLGQGSVAVADSDGNPVVLTSAYRTLRGGFAVRF